MEWAPAARAVVARVAVPAADSVAVPRLLVPSRNVTVLPAVGVAVAGAADVTVAVNVTDWPTPDGLVAEVTVAFVLALLIVCVMAAEVLVAKLGSPAKTT